MSASLFEHVTNCTLLGFALYLVRHQLVTHGAFVSQEHLLAVSSQCLGNIYYFVKKKKRAPNEKKCYLSLVKVGPFKIVFPRKQENHIFLSSLYYFTSACGGPI